MKKTHTEKLQRGFSLVELMVAMALGLVLVAGVVQVFVGNVQVFKTNSGIGRVQENARFVIAEIAKNVRSVGYAGCFSKDFTVTNQADPIYNVSSVAADLLMHQVPASGEIVVGAETISNAVESTDAITIKTLVNRAKLTAATTATTVTVADASGYAAGDVIFIGDCEKNDIADIDSVSGNVITLADAITIPYGPEAEVYEVAVLTYYIAPSSRANLSGVNSLYKKINGAAGRELAIGVNNLQFLAGVDNDATADNIPNQFFSAGDASVDAKRVMVVRMLLNTTSIQSVGTEGVIDRDFTVSISLRNRLAAGAG